MTKQEFQTLTQRIILLDGATGSNLMAAGMPKGVCTEEWVLAHKDVIQELQRAYIEAGSNIIYAPTFGGNRVSLSMHGIEDRIEEINRTLVSYSREVADAASLIKFINDWKHLLCCHTGCNQGLMCITQNGFHNFNRFFFNFCHDCTPYIILKY